MSTRAVYSFVDEDDAYHVYKHHDGYPSGAAGSIENAIANAWALPRFEADEFAASFVAANKAVEAIAAREPDHDSDFHKLLGRGGIRLMRTGDWQKVSPGDIAYRYVISWRDNQLWVEANRVCCPFETDEWDVKLLFSGPFQEFKVQAKAGKIVDEV